MKYRSVFDIIGPVMIGPSSSHTAGAARMGLMARRLFGRQPEQAEIHFYGSFAKTYKGHGTDIAIVGGVLGLSPFDKRMVDSLKLAKQMNVDIRFFLSEELPAHPNTAKIVLRDEKESLSVTAISIGGGKMEATEINGFSIRISGDQPSLFVWHEDRYGLVAAVSQVLANHQVNIGYMEMARKSKGSEALMVIETDQPLHEEVCRDIQAIPHVMAIKSLQPLQ